MNAAEALATKVTRSYNPMDSFTSAHLPGCKAAGRRIKGYESEVRENGVTVADLIEMQANPDEGTYKIHACLKPVVDAAKKA
jgi:hypothetical protein